MACGSSMRGARVIPTALMATMGMSMLLVAGCASESESPSTSGTTPSSSTPSATDPEPTTTTSAPPTTFAGEAEAAYVAALKANVPDLADEPDQALVEAGRDVCATFDSSGTFDDAIAAAGTDLPAGPLVLAGEPDDPPVGAYASGIVLSAVRDLCPQYEGELPG